MQSQQKVSQAEETIQEQRKPRFGPIRKNIQENKTEQVEQTLSSKEQLIVQAQTNANWIQGIEAFLFLTGVGSVILSFSKRSKR